MRYSMAWIREWVQTDRTDRELLDILTRVGLTVDTVDTLENDTVFDLDLTTNRPDALSHRGVARELSAALRLPMKNLAHTPGSDGDPTSVNTSVTIEDAEACPRYACQLIREVKVGPSPAWLAERLDRIGIRPINNMVDITNYVLAAYGQPLHAFDFEKLTGRRIIVRKARQGERLTTLDGVERTLTAEDLVIADESRACALAGIMGGEDSEIGPSTRTVLLESAYFDPTTIRRTSRRLGLTTEASQRFSRGQDPEIPVQALGLAEHLIRQLDCGNPATDVVDACPEPFQPPRILFRRDRLFDLLGISIEDDFILSTLTFLGCTIDPAEDGWKVTPPPFRPDLLEEIDLVEEIARHYGYDRIPAEMPEVQLGTRRFKDDVRLEESMRDAACSVGLSEVYSYVFQNEEDNRFQQPLVPLKNVKLSNPLAETAAFLRVSLLPGLLRTHALNRSRGRADLALFEIGQVYGRIEGGYESYLHLGILLSGRKAPLWIKEQGTYSLFDLKGMVSDLIGRVTRDTPVWESATIDSLHPYQSAMVRLNGTPVAFCGKVSRESVYFAEIHLPGLLRGEKRLPEFTAFSSFPGIVADVTFGHNPGTTFSHMLKAIWSSRPDHLLRVILKDRFTQKDGIIKTTFRLEFQSMDRSLTQEEVNEQRDRIVASVLTVPNVTFG
ncbi:MAG TPA: phenylalanine--tRNA ligase subunit beta [Thermoanaerobaculia bacterium]|nr:phenylalanine--tRNA ligase subunit beta [Thermoanaerobaculia bacterium]HUM30685.1 phenylalanine--tRNA ligase subunit beta [Thermoanaerobaculia bacterium]HXK68907.1 phenylalanine--tRNA ligase subunit beta [Thermoanaerobaculia bacterium]